MFLKSHDFQSILAPPRLSGEGLSYATTLSYMILEYLVCGERATKSGAVCQVKLCSREFNNEAPGTFTIPFIPFITVNKAFMLIAFCCLEQMPPAPHNFHNHAAASETANQRFHREW